MADSQHIDHRTIAATVHGRFLVRAGPPERLLVGFHGYAETAETHLGELLKIGGVGEWTVVSIQALHPFYTSREQRIVASWMTRLDRELAIEDNKAYVRSVLDYFHQPQTVVFAGFSQGGAMAYRAAADSGRAAGLIVLAADVPPDVTSIDIPVLIGRGERDDWYTEEKVKKDLKFLPNAQVCVFDGGHEWTDEFRAAAANFLERLR
ncbi:MAG TPA: alpha/beta hydrolase [Thermoanaerobaculia bacterium]|nr:alpha/beta hydrolase [Thermoanaerobaculia bacterium]